MDVFSLLPATGVAEDHKSVGEAVQVVVSKVQSQWCLFHKAPNCVPPLEIRQHCYPLQQHFVGKKKKNHT